MIQIEELLKNNSGVDDYRVVSKRTRSYEVFFVHRKLETVRATDTVSTEVTVYVNHGGKLGDSGFELFESMTEAEAEAKIASAVERAKLVSNEPYELPRGGKSEFTLDSNFTRFSLPELAAKVADAVFAADSYTGGSINATEIFLYEDITTIRNSRGIHKTQVKHHAMIEAIPTWNEGQESVELYESHRFTEFDPAAITAEINRKMQEVRDRQLAVKLETPKKCNVVLNPQEIESVLRSVASNMNYSALYTHSNLYQVGDDLQAEGSGDKLTLTMVSQIRGSADSSRFDEDGVELLDRTILEDGKFVANFGANRYACYLGQAPTGNLRCMKLAPGSMTRAQMEEEPYLECVSMSGLQVDRFNDYVGGEIRLAYYFDGEKRIPVTGISFSAKLSQVIANLRLGDTTVCTNGYEGPEKMLLPQVSVL